MFGRVLNMHCCAVFGGSEIKGQINDLKAGVHAVVCTPGRMIDLLVTSNGSITNLRRVTMLVIDEADRMFDMGFEPQITRIIQNIRPDRQTVMFSATFPRQVETLAREILDNPIEVQVRPPPLSLTCHCDCFLCDHCQCHCQSASTIPRRILAPSLLVLNRPQGGLR